MKCIILVLFVSSLTTFTMCAQSPSQLGDVEKSLIDSILVMDVPDGGAGLAIGIVRDGEIIYQDYAGFANIEDSILINEETRFNIASNGKQFTAFAILRLAHHNKLNLQDDFRTFLPSFFTEVEEKITIQNLLNHTSGIRDFYDLWSLEGKTWWRESADNKDVLGLLKKQNKLNFKPDSQYLYSNSNYVLLAEIIEKVTGNSFIAYTQELFDDLKMSSSSFESDYNNIIDPVALPYFNFDTWTTFNWINNIVGDGALFSTLTDQLQWEKIIQTHKSYPLSADVIEKSQKPISDSEFKNYGYGIEFDDYLGKSLVYHLGATGAWKAVTYRFPEENVSIVVLTNSGKIIPLLTAQAISKVLFGGESHTQKYITQPVEVGSRVEIEDLVGTYQNENGFSFRFVNRVNELFLLRNGRNDTKLVRESANIFHQWNDPAFKQEFKVNSNNVMQVTAYYTTHAPYTLTKIEADFEEYDFKKLEGNFANSETDATLDIRYFGNQEFKVTISGREFTAQLLKPSLLKVGNYSIHIDEKTNYIEEILLDGDRIKKVTFRRD